MLSTVVVSIRHCSPAPTMKCDVLRARASDPRQRRALLAAARQRRRPAVGPISFALGSRYWVNQAADINLTQPVGDILIAIGVPQATCLGERYQACASPGPRRAMSAVPAGRAAATADPPPVAAGRRRDRHDTARRCGPLDRAYSARSASVIDPPSALHESRNVRSPVSPLLQRRRTLRGKALQKVRIGIAKLIAATQRPPPVRRNTPAIGRLALGKLPAIIRAIRGLTVKPADAVRAADENSCSTSRHVRDAPRPASQRRPGTPVARSLSAASPRVWACHRRAGTLRGGLHGSNLPPVIDNDRARAAGIIGHKAPPPRPLDCGSTSDTSPAPRLRHRPALPPRARTSMRPSPQGG